MTKAIIFDMGGVLINDPWPGMLKHYLKHLKVSKEKFENAYDVTIDRWQTGRMSEVEYWQKMTEIMQVKMPTSESLWLEGFKSNYREKNGVFKLLEKLKKKGFKLALLSNTEVPIMEFLVDKQYKHFDVFIYSCQEKIAKPDKRIYIETVNRLGVEPHEAIFVDDKEENVTGAQKAGLTGIKFESPEQLEEMLDTLLN